MLKIFCSLIIAVVFSSCASTKVNATYSRSNTETKSVKVESVISILKIPVTVCYILSDAEIPFRVDFPINIRQRTITLSYEAKYDNFRDSKIQGHMISVYIPF